jgi:tRNA threonylcarbamoyladenosine biosynthesis protein TsaE
VTSDTILSTLQLITRSTKQTQQIGVYLGRLALPKDVFLLVGQLGAGKTCLTQGIAWGLGIKDWAASPSFVIIRELQGRLPLFHVDLYRLDQMAEISDLGLEDYFSAKGVCVIEWAEKGLSLLPAENLLINISFLAPDERKLKFTATGSRYHLLLKGLKNYANSD